MIKTRLQIFMLYFFCSLTTFSQTKKELEAQRKKLKAEIRQVNSLLFKEQKKEKNVLEDLSDIQQKIAVRQELINTINLEAALLSKTIDKNTRKIAVLEKELEALKADYAAMIFKSYKSRSKQSRLMFLLSSQSFYQAYKRVSYLEQYTSFRKKQGEEIGKQALVVQQLIDSLTYKKQSKDSLIVSEKDQKKQIELDKKRQELLLAKIKKKESAYKRNLQKKIAEEKRVAQKLDKIIKAAIEKANRLAAKKLKSTPKTSKRNEFILSPEAKELAANFELNRGKLPWPVKEGVVVRRFGKQRHPTFPGIEINGTGLHIVTNQNNNALAIFNGTVLNVLVSAEGRRNVLIQHGNYISSYNNLDKLYVRKGDVVKTGQNIGHIFTDKVSGKTTLIFVLYKNTTKLNPAVWLLKR